MQSEIVQRTPWRKRKSGLILPDREGSVWCAPPAGVSIPLIKSGKWTPSNLTGLVAAFDPAFGTDTVVDGALITTWNAIRPAGLNVGGVGASKPKYKLSWVNGQPAIDFTAGSRSLFNSTTNLVTANSAYTVFAVAQAGTFGGGAIVSIRLTTQNSNSYQLVAGGIHYIHGDGVNAGSNISLVTPLLATIQAPFQSVTAYKGGATQPDVFINKVSRPLSGGTIQGTETGTLGFYVGYNSNGQGLEGFIGYLAIVIGTSSTQEIALWNFWANARFGFGF